MLAGAGGEGGAALDAARAVLFRAVQHKREEVDTVYGAMLALEQEFQHRQQASGVPCFCVALHSTRLVSRRL